MGDEPAAASTTHLHQIAALSISAKVLSFSAKRARTLRTSLSNDNEACGVCRRKRGNFRRQRSRNSL